MAFQSIGFTAALILNRLRNEKEINGSKEERRESDEREKKGVDSELPVRVSDER